MQIRKYREEDLPAIMALGNEAWRPIRRVQRDTLGDEIFNVLHPKGADVDKGLEIQDFARKLPDNIFVCEDNGRIIGFILFRMSENGVGEICNNAADKTCGIKGIGQAMYAAVLEHFRANGMKVVCVHTGLDEGHAPARRAYERAGFSLQMQHTTYYMKL